MSYIWLHATRMSYSSAKTHIKNQYELTNILMAIVDATIYIGLGIGYLTRYLTFKKSKQLKHFLIVGILFNAFYMLFPLLSILGLLSIKSVEPIYVLCMFFYGYFQLHHWVVLLSKLN